ncbi:DUF5134 domain-containing protein [Streptomyces sp. NPDC005953]|uniref:DUF5134 domain-containing protein n=1 Tax=Streptomyces sp. NPDC005953 TaxID=3156719 RepID=UPI0033FBCD85
MHGPAVSGWLLVALCGGTGTYGLVQLRTRSGPTREAVGGEALMGCGMAAMAVPSAAFAPPDWAWTVYAVVYGVAALAALRVLPRGIHHLHHLIGLLAMVYMAIAMAYGDTHSGHAAGGLPALTGALAVYYAGYVLAFAARLAPTAAHKVGTVLTEPSDVPPEMLTACRLAMGVAMLAMLLML